MDEQADFNMELARLQAGAEALAAAAAQDPELAARLAAVMGNAVPDAKAAEEQAQEAARANSLKVLNDRVMQTLAVAAAQAPIEEPDPEPEGEPGGA